MIALIAESKTMSKCDCVIAHDTFAAHCPSFNSRADAIMDHWHDTGVDELSKTARLSPAMARKLVTMIYEFPNKSLGQEAIKAYTGVVFKAFDYNTLDDCAKATTATRVRIISSLYGWLKPCDIVKPYRLEFSSKLSDTGTPATSFWREDVTDALIHDLATNHETEVLNLLPADAARCIDWTKVERNAKVWQASFFELIAGGERHTPNSNLLKQMRGRLLRKIITNNIKKVHDLNTMSTHEFTIHPDETTGIVTIYL